MATITPTKTKTKTKKAAAPTPAPAVETPLFAPEPATAKGRIDAAHEMLRTALAELANPDTNGGLEHAMAGAYALFVQWVGGNPWTATLPRGYEGRLSRALTWLQALPKEDRAEKREFALNTLKRAWERYAPQMCDWDALPGVWTPAEDEFGPLHQDARIPDLPAWEDTELGRLAEEFDVYAGLVIALNLALGYPCLDVEDRPENVL